MTENERIKELRKNYLHLTLAEFGERIGVRHSAISNIENGIRNVTDQMRTSICREYGVREEWLREGTGDIFIKKSAEDELGALADKIMRDTPDSFRRRFVAMLAKLNDEQWKLLSDMEDMMLATKSDMSSDDSDRDSIEQLHADLDREIALQKKQGEGSTGSGSMPVSGTRKNGSEESAV